VGRMSKQTRVQLAAILAIIASVFALSRATPPALTVEILYLPLILFAAWRFTPGWTWFLFFLCTALTFLDAGLDFRNLTQPNYWLGLVNTIAEVLMGALVTWLALWSRAYAGKLQETCDSLSTSESHQRTSEALFRSLVENIPQCVFSKDLQGRFTYANSRFCEAVGRSMKQVVGATDFDHFPQHLASKYRADDLRVAETGMTLEIIEDFQSPDGSLRQLQTVKTPVLDATGRVIGTQGFFWDLTERIRAEESTRRSEREFRTLVEDLPDVVARFDHDNRHVYINRAVQNITGLPPEQFLGKTNAELNMPDHLVCLWHEAIQAVFDTATQQTIEFAYNGCQGVRHFECRLMPESAPDGSVESVLAIGRDVTEQIRAHHQAQLHLTELAHTTRLSTIGGLVSEIAHEINQPLHAIVNFSQAAINVLEKNPIDQRPNLFNWLKQISEQANRAAEIIRNAGRFVRNTPARRVNLNFNKLVRESLLLINLDLRMHHVMLRCELADNLPLIHADAVQIQQVLMNLLRNAMEAVAEIPEDRRHLEIRTTSMANSIQVSVRDTGTGLGSQNLEKVFKPFFTTKSEGIGLGLAVSQSIVQAHQGRLWAKNNSDQGATFYFTLPTFKEEPHRVYGRA
jgi:PAS domain S-box-containing protein